MTPEQWDSIGELFERGLELPPHEREQLLIGLNDPELAAELRDLWEHTLDQGFLAKPIAKPPTIGNTAADAPRAGDSDTGTVRHFGPYRTIRLIGQGGMGLVYLAEQEGILNRRVAIKIVRHHLPTTEVLKRFEAERQTLARMDHPGIAKIFDAGTASDGRPYFVMEYVDGPSLTDYCDQNLLNHRARLDLFRQVCLAVHHAHQKGVIHRDIKPSNVLVATVDGKPTPRIIDFGIAKAIDRPFADVSLFTEHGLLVGTPQYMSPEQASGESANLDTTSDVYSLGVLLYELLVGAAPFDIKELRKLGIAAMHRAIAEQDPPSPSARFSSLGRTSSEVARLRNTEPQALLRALRGDIEWILRKALEKNRAMRYQSASEFGEDISRYLQDMAVTASPPSLAYELRKFARRHRGRVAAAGAMLALILLSAALALFLYARAEKARSLAEWSAYKATLAAAFSNLQEFRASEARELLLSTPPALRGWEWKHLFWSTDTSLAALHAGQGGGSSMSVGFASNGAHLYVATATSVHAWDLATRRRLHDYGPFGLILTMSSDGQHVVVPFSTPTQFGVDIMEVTSRRSLRQLTGHHSAVVNAQFSPDGHQLVTIDTENHVILWNLVNGLPIRQFPPDSPPRKRTMGKPVEQIAINTEGSRIAVTDSNRVRLLDTFSGRTIAVLSAHQVPIQTLAFSKDGKRLLSAAEFLRMWDAATGEILPGMSNAPGTPFRGISTASFHPSLDLAVAAAATQIQIWNPAGGFIVTSLQVPSFGLPRAIVFSPDGKFLIGMNTFGIVRIWDGPSLGGDVLRAAGAAGYSSMELSRDGGKLALSTGSDFEIVDAQNGRVIHAHHGAHRLPLTQLVFSPSGSEVASASNDRQVCIWPLPSASSQRCAVAHSSPVTALLYTPDGKQLISGGADGMVRFWDSTNLAKLREYTAGGPVATLAIDPGGKIVVAGLLQPTGKPRLLLAHSIDVATAKPGSALQGIDAYSASIRSIRFSPDGSKLYIGDAGNLGVGIWDPHSGRKLGVLPLAGKQGYGNRWSAISPSGDRLVATYGDGSMSIWNPISREIILQMFRVSALHVQFSRDGSKLYANTGGAIQIFDTRPSISPEALDFIASLENRFPLRCEARQYLRTANIDRKLADQALSVLDHQPEEAHLVSSMIDDVLAGLNRKPEEYELALRRSQMLFDTFPWEASAHIRRALALYRTGKYPEAIAALQTSNRWNPLHLQHRRLILSLAERHLGKPVDLKNLPVPAKDQDPQGRALWEELTSSR